MRLAVALLLSVVIAAAANGCADSAPEEPMGSRAASAKSDSRTASTSTGARVVYYDALSFVSPPLFAHVDICRVVKGLRGPAGIYRVTELKGVSGPDGDAFTYVTFERVKAWSNNAPAAVTARTPGGPTANGGTRSSIIALRLKEEVGIIFGHGARNAGYPAIHPLGLFKRTTDGGYSNGQFVAGALGRIGGLVRQIEQSGQCPAQKNAAIPAPNKPKKPKSSHGIVRGAIQAIAKEPPKPTKEGKPPIATNPVDQPKASTDTRK